MAQLGAGYAFRSIFGVPIHAGTVSVAVGGSGRSAAGYASLHYLQGQTQYGRRVQALQAGGGVDWREERFRFGLGGKLGAVTAESVSHTPDSETLSLGILATFAYDLYRHRSNDGAWYAELATEADVVPMYGVTLSLGYRWP